ncbi:Oidioi.mRNA.OKI2018_I69.chr1.g71.t1.cds [Oikopleura dioica]|uniref:Oidioi.mRNA.OKI2018_I69.chr1.g71.t1.cds n=1 Tax=Oikopleura dioica TaxID=34765 RepID=A0ABN7SMJ3_OIKDI|nr:Oidioi.mRNA.OKI2018_I69.chr1.g71.t1.cds [Oikopleura dioica]
MERDKNHPVSRNASEAESVFTERSGTLSTRNAPRTRKSRNVSTQILSSIRRVSQQSIESIKRVARNGDFITIVSLVTAGQGNGFFTIPWVWANGSLVPCLLLAFLTIFAYSFIGITVFEMSERHVGLIPSLGKDELPDISFIIDYKYGRNDALTCWPAAFYVSSFMPLLMSILKDVENRKHTRRDIVISQILSQSLNIIVGLTFLLTFPGDKSEISQNFVENFRDSKVATILCFAIIKVFGYTYIGITIFSESEKCVGLIPTLEKDELPELSMIVDYKFGRNWGLVCLIFAFLQVFGALLASYINLSNSLYWFGLGCYEIAHENELQNISQNFSVEESFSSYWSLTGTIPLFLVVIIFIVNVKSSIFFSRIAAIFGLPSTIIISIILFWKASEWKEINQKIPPYPVISGDLTCFPAIFYTFSYMPLLMAVIKDNKNRGHTKKDIFISQILCQIFNVVIGLTFVWTFPGDRSKVSENFVEHIRDSKEATLVCFALMIFRFVGSYSLCFQVCRTFISGAVFKKVFPGYAYSIFLSVFVIGLSVLCAMFYNKPGTVLSIVGSICGLYFASLIGIFDLKQAEKYADSPCEAEKCVGKIPTIGKNEIPELSLIVEHKFGKTAGIVCVIVGSILVLFSICSIYLFICRSLYYFVLSSYTIHSAKNTRMVTIMEDDNSTFAAGISNDQFKVPETFHPSWDLNWTIPFYCILLIFLVNKKSSVFFTRLTTVFGLPSTIIISIILFWKASVWGKLGYFDLFDENEQSYYPLIKWTYTCFPAIFYNCTYMPNILSVLKDNKNRNHTRTDIVLSQILCQSTNLIIGLTFIATYPGDKSRVYQNFVEHFDFDKPEYLISCILIFFRGIAGFCLNFQTFRCILSSAIFRRSFPGYGWSVVMSIFALACSVLCGVYYNNPGKLLGIGGSITGVYYAFLVAWFDLNQYGSFLLAPWYVYLRSGALAIFSLVLLVFQLLVTFMPNQYQ